MVSVGSRALPLGRHKSRNISGSLMCEENNHSSQILSRRKMGRKGNKKGLVPPGGGITQNQSGDVSGSAGSGAIRFTKEKGRPILESFIRKQVDPETAKYFSEIANVLDGNEVGLEERSTICGTALEEARGKEVELATDYVISHTVQTLLEECSVEALCSFLQGCSKYFSYICMDRSGSHVAETALRSLARHLEDEEKHILIKKTLSSICQAVVQNPMDIMCSSYGSHFMRRLLCLCKGVSVDSTELHSINPGSVLSDRLNLRSSRGDSHAPPKNHAFPEQLGLLMTEMLSPDKADIEALLVDQYSSLVLQTTLKLLDGQEEDLLRIIPVLLGYPTGSYVKGTPMGVELREKISSLVRESAYSHLMEVILAVAPNDLYTQILTEVFKGSLFTMSSNLSANYVVQSLVSHARNKKHIKLIFEELGSKFYYLLEMGRAGVIAAIVSACQKIQFLEKTCCQCLADSVSLENESSPWIIPRILFLDSYFATDNKDNWSWPNGKKMHILGSLILQSVFKFPTEFIEPYITSITSLEDVHVLQASKDPAGTRVIEAFLVSNASAKQKRQLSIKLQGHFGELSLLPSGSFTVEKCFNASNLSLKETILSELSPLQSELSKTKQGPHLLKKLDVEWYTRKPDQWRSKQTSKQSTYKAFHKTFGSKNSNSSSSQGKNFLADAPPKRLGEGLKGMRKEIETRISSDFHKKPETIPFVAGDAGSKWKKTSLKRGGFAKDFDHDNRKNKKMKMAKDGNSSSFNKDKSAAFQNRKKRQRS